MAETKEEYTVEYWHDDARTLGPYVATFTSQDEADRFAIGVITDHGSVDTDTVEPEPESTPPATESDTVIEPDATAPTE